VREAPARGLVHAACVAALVFAPAAAALAPHWHLTQFDLRCYGPEQGLASDNVQRIVQDRDGYLWTSGGWGAVRFDGVRARTPPVLDPPVDERDFIGSLVAGGDGSVWLGLVEGGLVRVLGTRADRPLALGRMTSAVPYLAQLGTGAAILSHEGRYFRLELGAQPDLQPLDAPPDFGNVHTALESEGELWVGGTRGVARRDASGIWQRYDTGDGLTDNLVWYLTRDRRGRIFAATRGGVSVHFDRRWQAFDIHPDLRGEVVRQVLEDRDGTLWIATAGAGLFRHVDGRTERLTTAEGLGSNLIWSLLEDREGNLWMPTAGAGLCRLGEESMRAYTRREGLRNDLVRAVIRTRDGRLWTGGNGGVHWLVDEQVIAAPLLPAAGDNAVMTLLERADGSVYAGTHTGVFAWTGSAFERRHAEVGYTVYALAEDRAGALWIGGSDGLLRADGANTRAFPIDGPRAAVDLLRAGRDGGVWVGLGDGRLLRADAAGLGQVTRFGDRVRDLIEDADGTLWVTADGLWRGRDGSWTQLGGDAGFPVLVLSSLIEDRHGDFWIGSGRGLFRVSRAAASAWQPGLPLPVMRYDTRDGLPTAAIDSGRAPGAWADADGRLWFASNAGLVEIDPARMAVEPGPPVPALLDLVRADDRELALAGGAVSVSSATARLEFAFTAIHHRSPLRLAFRYRLLPLEPEWIDVADARTALYRQLPPGEYSFEVQARRHAEAWPDTATRVPVTVVPRWHETLAFRLGLGVLALAVLLALPALRIRALRAERMRLEALVGARTAEIAAVNAELTGANQRLEALARTDALTGLANRRRFEHALAQALDAGPVGLVVIDVDHFKRYNDRAGHAAGDECLRAVGAALAAAVRDGELAARPGGEEFAVLLPGADADITARRAAAFHRAIGALALPHPDSPTAATVTASVGHACTARHGDAQRLYVAADRALYAAKAAGRDRVMVDSGD
jgi:diguanylate cyclase (GGDEF)-like protein